MTPAPIGFLGLGRLGLPVAKNLLETGHPLTVWNRTPEKADSLVAKGAIRAARPVHAVTPGGVIVTLLWDDDAVEDILYRPGFLKKLGDGLHISMSTLSPAFSEALAARHARFGSAFVEAPIFGGPDAAAGRQLFVPIAGLPAAKARARPLIEAMGAKAIYDFGEEAGASSIVKLVGNFLILSAAASLREGLALADKSGVDPKAVLAMMTEALFACPTYRNHGRIIVEGSTRLAQSAIPEKDLGLFEAMADAVGAPATLARVLREMRRG